jgi:ubiquinol-cytochrome c reductase cytochrome c1 subunit
MNRLFGQIPKRFNLASLKQGAKFQGENSWFGYSMLGGLYAAGAMSAVAVSASDDHIPPPHQHWSHGGFFDSYDCASLRRGYEVYRQVCSSCHSMDLIAYRNLIGVTHTEEQAKMIAAQYEVDGGFDDEGEKFERPAKLSDYFNGPYSNENAARAANGGALPPDLSCIVKARHSGDDYVYALITGYKEPPAGVVLRPGLHYNPYFPGGAIGMAPPLSDGQVEYEDGTPATVSQMAKDVATFLRWCSEPEQDERKKAGLKWATGLAMMVCGAGYYKRFKWSHIKTRRISWMD